MSELSKKLAKDIQALEVAIDETRASWEAKKARCANVECGRDLRRINPTFGIKDKKDQFCSRRCRSTVTGERWESDAQEVQSAPPSEKTGKAGKQASAAKPVAQEKAGKKAAASGGSQPEKPAAPKAPRSGGINPEGKLHLVPGKKLPNFQGARKQVWDLFKEGITVGEFLKLADAKGLDGKGNLGTFVRGYGVLEIR